MILVVLRFTDTGAHWWMMTDLFSEIGVVLSFQLESLSEYWIKGFVQPSICTLVLRDAKTGHKLNSNNRIFFHICLSQQVLVLHYLGYFLHHAKWLVKVNGNTETSQIFTNRVF